MEKMHFEVEIHAPREKVWNAMLEDVTYRQWTKPFNEGSVYEGSWEEGSIIKFYGCDENGNQYSDGMYSQIKENRKYEFVSIEHLGMIENGVVDTTSEKVKKWAPAFENYTFTDSQGGTLVAVDVDTNKEYTEMFKGVWPKALQILKDICENN
jgi:Activator of Hsp90 ATPase homolog 1-like protein